MDVRWLCGTALAVSIFAANPAFAQDAAVASPASATQDGDEGYGEITVTAQRREQRLSEVPISVTALTAESLANSGIVSSTDLATVTPGLQFPVAGAFAQPTIRGIGTTVTSAGSDPNVALYVDGVYMPSQAGNIFNFNNIQRIEVLKGPQGTLYGRNATGGAINITTYEPSFSPQMRLKAGYGSFDEVRLNGYATTGIGNVAALSLAGLYVDDDGYSYDSNLGVNLSTYDERGVQGKLLVEPLDSLKITVAGDWSRKRDLTGYTLKPLNGNVAQPALVSPDPFVTSLSFVPDFSSEAYGSSVTAKLDVGSVLLTSITSLRQVDAHFFTDLDRTAVANVRAEFDTAQRTFTQEVNLAGQSGSLDWVGGIFYYDDRADNINLRINGAAEGSNGRITSEAVAGYGEGTLAVTEQLSVTAGLRYSTEKRHYTANRPTGMPMTVDASVRYSAWTPRVAVRFELSDTANVYASYNNGFKSGTYNISSFSTTPVRPESVDAFEAGLKYYDRGISLSAAGFYYSYGDIQVQSIVVTTGLTALTNAAKAEIWGLEGNAEVPMGAGFTARAGLAYTHGRYSSFPGALVTRPRTTDAECGTNPNRPCGNTQGPEDASGNVMVRTPDLTANGSIDYEGVLAGGEFRGSITASYNSGFFWDAGNRLEQSPYLLFNGRLSWGPEGGPWRVALWGRNLTNKTYQQYVADTTAADAVSYARPRSVGVSLELDLD